MEEDGEQVEDEEDDNDVSIFQKKPNGMCNIYYTHVQCNIYVCNISV